MLLKHNQADLDLLMDKKITIEEYKERNVLSKEEEAKVAKAFNEPKRYDPTKD